MNRMVTSTLTAVALSCAVASAQSGAQTTSPPASTPQTPAAGAQARNPVTYTGCLQAASSVGAPATAPAGATTAQTTAPASYILTNVAPSAASTTGTAGAATAGTSGTAGTASVASSFILEPAASVNLTPHVGHRVSVTGTIQPLSMGAGGGAATGVTNREDGATGRAGAATATAAGARPSSMTPRLQVSAVQMISTECPAK